MSVKAIVATAGLLAVFGMACSPDYGPIIAADWQVQIGDSAAETSFGLAATPDGEIVVTAATEGALAGEAAGKRDVFLARYTSDGNEIWALQLGGPANDSPLGVSVAADGTIYVAGFTEGDFAGDNQGSADAWIAQFDADGNENWRRQLGGDQWDRGFDVTAFADGAYLTGYSASELDPGTYSGGFDGFAARYDAEGTQVWVRQFGSDATDWGQGSALAPDDGLYVTGYTEGSLDGANLGDKDAFVIRLAPTGDTEWVRQFGSDALDWTQGVGQGPDGGVLVAGTTEGSTSSTSQGERDLIVASFSADGDHVFTAQLGTTGADSGFEVRLADDLIVVTGTTTGALGGRGDSAGDRDAVLVWLDHQGELVDVSQFGSARADDATGLDVFDDGSIIYSGYTATIDGPSDIIMGGLAPKERPDG